MFSSATGSLFVGSQDYFVDMRSDLAEALLSAPIVHPAKWQQLDVSESPMHSTHELLNVTVWYDMPNRMDQAQVRIEPDLPWAEAHFQERVGGLPINPGVEHANWPYHANGAELHLKDGKYDHNYMERMWASRLEDSDDMDSVYWRGYRFETGDLGDVIKQLRAEPTTRQAYLPIWFPEDTGAKAGQRVPCTLGYHFIIRDGRLHLQYNLRSCEIYRHFTNDVYMAVRLAQWVRGAVSHSLMLGQLSMNIVSMHGFVGDVPKIREFVL